MANNLLAVYSYTAAMRAVSLCFFAFLLCVSFSGEDKIKWKADRPLSWKDFKGKHETNTGLHAFTYTEIALKMLDHESPDSLLFEVICTFDKTKSSVLKGKETDSLLKHEQGHFDLGEIYTRLIRKKISETVFKSATISQQLNTIYKACFDQYVKEQDKYDLETDHSMNGASQGLWNIAIQRRLKELEKFGHTAVSAGVKK